MPKTSVPGTGAAVAVVGAAVLLVGWMSSGSDGATPDNPAPKGPERGSPALKYLPAEQGCGAVGCHSTPPTTKDPLVCRCVEFPIWKNQDKHSNAYEVLFTPRARRMGVVLGYDVTKRAECVNCHGVPLAHEEYLDVRFDRRQEGVSCNVCHGATTKWISHHSLYPERDKWRVELDREKKEREYGMIDLWNPLRRAELCASCHIGNKKEGKFVTHEMYAAGHPPLPGFEAAAFSDMMPRHWQYLRDKPAASRNLILKGDSLDREHTKLVLVGALINLRESMRLLAEQAADCVKATDPDRRALDLANFDCYACHHELQSSSWRQKRPAAGRPGRVPMQPWPTALVELAIAQAAKDPADAELVAAEYRKRLRAVRDAFDARPYADTRKLALAASSLAAWAGRLAEFVNALPCTAADARRILALFPEFSRARVPDYDSARQIAWAFRSIYREYRSDPARHSSDEPMDRSLRELEETLPLEFLPGKVSIEPGLADGLKKRNDYDPGPFLKALDSLAIPRPRKGP